MLPYKITTERSAGFPAYKTMKDTKKLVISALLAAFATGAFTSISLAAGLASSATGIPFNIAQGVVGIVISLILLPILSKIKDIKDWIAA